MSALAVPIGLQKHPKDFDLAYNKARLQLELSQNPTLLEHIGVEETAWLQETLASHQYASSLNSDNPDVLFNTAQVLSSLAELYAEEDQMAQAIAFWEQDLEILSTTLATQEIRFEQHQADLAAAAAEAAAEDGGVPLGDAQNDGGAASEAVTGESADTEMGEESATIEEPVTAFDLLDTVHASMQALIGLMAAMIAHDASSRGNLLEMANFLTKTKAAHYLSLLPEAREQIANEEDATEAPGSMASYRVETARLYAQLVSVHAQGEYESQRMDLATWGSRLDEAFTFPMRRRFVNFLETEARARRDVAKSAMQTAWLFANCDDFDDQYDGSRVISSSVVWKQLSLAQDALAAAVTLKDEEALALRADLYRLKGDIELLRHRILHCPWKTIDPLPENLRLTAGPTLAQNAQKFYQGAAAHAQRDNDEVTFTMASARLAAARGLAIVYAARRRAGGSSAADAAAAEPEPPLPPWPNAAERAAIEENWGDIQEDQLMSKELVCEILQDAPPR